MKMTSKHKKFILKELIPFILELEGRHFDMYSWGLKRRVLEGGKQVSRGVTLKILRAENCETAACIGGSAEALLFGKTRVRGSSFLEVGEAMGLSASRARNLFYGWLNRRHDAHVSAYWPDKYVDLFKDAGSDSLKQAEVAASLLRAVVETNGAVLD